jgi:hypothetical protein
MKTLADGYRGLSVLVWLNADRAIFLGAIALGLLAGAYFSGSMLPR